MADGQYIYTEAVVEFVKAIKVGVIKAGVVHGSDVYRFLLLYFPFSLFSFTFPFPLSLSPLGAPVARQVGDRQNGRGEAGAVIIRRLRRSMLNNITDYRSNPNCPPLTSNGTAW